jgi:peptide/nickel transport system ATP-binding protein
MRNNMLPLVETKDLKKYFRVPDGWLHAVDGIDISINEGMTLGIVGESGCGKSTLGRLLLQLLEPTDGMICFQQKDISSPNKGQLKELRKDMQMIFQDPYSSLNPRMTVAEIISEPMRRYRLYKGAALRERVAALMDTVGLEQRLENSYPHELDGGRRQRIGIARALALEPKFVVCDEPVSALDVSIQAQILNLMMDLQEEYGLTYMFITHDLSVVKHISDEIAVMYLGQIVEQSPADRLFEQPRHPYSQALLSAIPRPKIRKEQRRIILKGEISSPINPTPGCRFAPRCIHAVDECRTRSQELVEVEQGHLVACQRYNEI